MGSVQQVLATDSDWADPAEEASCATFPFGGYDHVRVLAPAPTPMQRAAAGIARRRTLLARAIETEVIPRLLLNQRARVVTPAVAILSPALAVELAGLARGGDATAATDFVAGLHAGGVSAERLYLDLLAAAARHLGELWLADLCSFADVTIGLMRLQQTLRALSPAFQADGTRAARRRQALLLALPGEQHTFGLVMVAEFFRRAGWNVMSEPAADLGELAEMVRRNWFGLVGISVGSDLRLDTLARAVATVRRASCNPAVGLLVGGPVFVGHGDLAVMVGADATAADGRQAVDQAEALLALLPRSA